MKVKYIPNYKEWTVNYMGRKHKGNQHYIMRYRSPLENLLYNILLQALRDNDIEYLRHGDGLIIWNYLKGVKL